MKRILIVSLLIIVMAFATIATVRAQSGGGYDLTWSTMDGGGGTSVGSGSLPLYTLDGTIGQPDAGVVVNGGGYTLAGGFWGGGFAQYKVYLTVVLK